MGYSISVIIATRNRTKFLRNLLLSLVENSHQPDQVIVVASGESIENIAQEFQDFHQWKFCHVDDIGQSAQKKIALSMVSKSVDWVVFLDDDVQVGTNFIKNIRGTIMEISATNVVGVGFRLAGTKQAKFRYKLLGQVLAKTKIAGRAFKIGVYIPYRFTPYRTEVTWLNGLSMWRKKLIDLYDLPFYNSRYAALEDVIFSQKVRKHGKLIYDPSIVLVDQSTNSAPVLSLIHLKYYSLWKFWNFADFSSSLFYIGYIIHLIYCMKLIVYSKNTMLDKLILIFQIHRFCFKNLFLLRKNRIRYSEYILALLKSL